MVERIQMREVSVELAMAGSDPAPHVIYLAPNADTIEEYLQNPRTYLPMSSDGVPRIVNKEQIAWIRTPPAGVTVETTAVRLETIVELTTGERMEGYTTLRTGVRLSDALNDTPLFLRIDDSSATYYVNKRMVRFAIPR